MSLTPDSTLSAQYTATHFGEYIAIYSRQSNIKIWNSSNGKKCIEISVKPNVGPYSVISWSRCELCVHFTEKIYWTSVPKGSNEGGLIHSILAYGTTGGSVGVMYALIDQEITSNTKTHSAAIQDVIWSPDCSKLYSSSDDKTIVEWTMDKKGLKPGRILKSGKKTVQKLACSCNGRFLITASTHIRVWDIENGVILQKISSHTSEVTSLLTLNDFLNGNVSHIVSNGENERMVSVCKLNLECESGPSSMLRCPYHPVSIKKSQAENNLFILAANGIVYIYLPPFENESSKPIAPISSLQIISDDETEQISIPILSVHCLKDQDHLLVMYGNISKPVFERIQIDLSQKRMTLERSYQRKSSLNEKQNMDVRSSNNSTVPMQTVPTHLSKKVKRKRHSEPEIPEEDETTLGELITRFDEIDDCSPRKDTATEPSAPITSGSHVQMLCQSLQSDDSSLFNQVISSTPQKSVHKTVHSLPINYVLPLIGKLMSIMHTTPFRSPILLNWIKPCLSLHNAYLLTVPDISDRLGLLYEILAIRSSCYESLCKLQGKLDLLVGSHTKDTLQAAESSVKPKFVFVDNDESSSDVDFTDFQELENLSRDESMVEESADDLMA